MGEADRGDPGPIGPAALPALDNDPPAEAGARLSTRLTVVARIDTASSAAMRSMNGSALMLQVFGRPAAHPCPQIG